MCGTLCIRVPQKIELWHLRSFTIGYFIYPKACAVVLPQPYAYLRNLFTCKFTFLKIHVVLLNAKGCIPVVVPENMPNITVLI